MRVKCLILCFSFFSLYCFAQDQICNNNTNDYDVVRSLCDRVFPLDRTDTFLLASSFIPNNETPIITIPININIWSENDGTGSYWQNNDAFRDSLQRVIDYLNTIYTNNVAYSLNIPNAQFISDTKVRFEIKNFYYYNNSTLAHSASNNDFSSYLAAYFPDRLKYFNWHLSLSTVVSYSGVSSGYNSVNQSIVTVRQNDGTPKHLYALAIHLAHEFGHNFGLNHTYNSEITQINHPEFLWDVFGPTKQSWCNSSPAYVCYHPADWECDYTDTSTHCTNNIMGGSKGGRHFSALQCGRIHRALSVSSLRKYACGYGNIPMTITGNVSWDFQRKVYQDIIVEANATLTISCDIEFVQQAKVIVKPGGKLVVNGATLTSDSVTVLWRGIEVWGTPDAAQYSGIRAVTSPQQGEVVLNNAVIKNAVCGVRVGRQHLRNISKGGGVVKATNTQFVNNQRAVHFYAYSHVNAYNRVVDNISYFNECTFSVDEHAYFSVDTSNVQVALYNVRGVQFNGCVFEDLQTKTNWKKYGTALYACQAGFRINGQIDNPPYTDPYYSTPCTFNNYKNAIAIVGSAEKPVKIYNTLFSDNSAGVNAKNADALSIMSCSFSNGGISYNIDVHGLILDSCNFYRIENNQFSGIGNGIKIIGKTEDNNTIRLNTFTHLCRAIEVYGTNGTLNLNDPSAILTGLQFECNEFIKDSTDIYIADQAVIKRNQGWWQKACGNYFGNQSYMHFNNLSGQNYYYFYNNNVPAQMPSRHNYLFITGTTPDICGERHGYIGDSYYDMQATVSNCEDRYNDHIELYMSALDNYNTTYGGISIDWESGIDATSNPQLFALIQLSELKNILDETCIEAVHLIGNATEVEIAGITTWLQRLSSLDADLMGIHYLTQGNDVSQLQLAWDQITQHYSIVNPEDTSYYQYCINQINAWARDTATDVNISQGAIDTITTIANSNNTASPYAVSVLECINEHYPWWRLRIHTSCNWVVPVESMSPKKETDQGQTDAIQLHPNPTNGMIEIKSNNLNIKQIELYDIFGKLLIEKKANESTVTLDVSPYAKGMYLLRYTLSDDTQQTKKIIKE